MSSKSKFLTKGVKPVTYIIVLLGNLGALSCATFRLFPESTMYFHFQSGHILSFPLGGGIDFYFFFFFSLKAEYFLNSESHDQNEII